MSHLTGTSLTIGTLTLPVVDCQAWHVCGRSAACEKNLDVSGCESCSERVSRGGDLEHPPIYGCGRPEMPRGAVRTVHRAAGPSTGAEAPAASPRPQKWRGLGDVIESATKAVGFRPCGGCARRRDALNRLVPFKGDPQAQDAAGAAPRPEPETLGDPEE